MGEFFTVEEVAKFLRMTKGAVCRLIKTKKIPAVKYPGTKRWLIHRDILKNFNPNCVNNK